MKTTFFNINNIIGKKEYDFLLKACSDFINKVGQDNNYASWKIRNSWFQIYNKGHFHDTHSHYMDKDNWNFIFYLNFIVRIIINLLHPKLSYFFLSITSPIVNSSVLVQKSLISKIWTSPAIGNYLSRLQASSTKCIPSLETALFRVLEPRLFYFTSLNQLFSSDSSGS